LVTSLLAINRSRIYHGGTETFLWNSRIIQIFRRGLETFLSKDLGFGPIFRRGLEIFPSKDFGIG